MELLRLVLYIFATALLYLGIPLLGWGLGDLGGYFPIPLAWVMHWLSGCSAWQLGSRRLAPLHLL